MSLGGQIAITLTRAAVAIASSRRPLPQSFFRGKAGGEIAVSLPQLFATCAMAQGSAAAIACEAATAATVAPALAARRAVLLHAEQIREHLLWLLGSALELLAEKPAAADLALLQDLSKALRAATGALDAATWQGVITAVRTTAQRLAARHVFVADHHSAHLADQFVDWCHNRQTPAARLGAFFIDQDLMQLGAMVNQDGARAPMDRTALFARLLGPGNEVFAALPDCAGAQPETTAFSLHADHPLIAGLRQRFGDGVLTRLAARQGAIGIAASRLQEHAGLAAVRAPSPFAVTAGQTQDGCGMATVETARGHLTHAARIEGGRIVEYRILAPTEWNFHPHGPLAQRLAAMTTLSPHAGLSLEGRARLLVAAFDPCVACHLSVH